MIPIILAFLVWSAVLERGGILNKSGPEVDDTDYFPTEACGCADYIVVGDDFFCFPVGDFQPPSNSYHAESIEAHDLRWRGCEVGQRLFILFEIEEECKDGSGACAPGGYICEQSIFVDAEGATHPMEVLMLKPIAGNFSNCYDGFDWELESD